jgi:hypothetical protein
MSQTVKAPTVRPMTPARRPRDLLDDAFDLCRDELSGFVDRNMRQHHFAGDNWFALATRFWLGDKTRDDAGNLLRVMDEHWACFAGVLDVETRTTVRELRSVRKHLGSTRPFTVAQAVRSVEAVGALLDAVGAHCRDTVSEILVALSLTDVGRDLSRVVGKVGAPARPEPVLRLVEEIRNDSVHAGWIDRVASHLGTPRYETAGTVHLETSGRVRRLCSA